MPASPDVPARCGREKEDNGSGRDDVVTQHAPPLLIEDALLLLLPVLVGRDQAKITRDHGTYPESS